jgi:hypothetical protein
MVDEGGLPARRQPLDRAAMERVLARAAELQAADADPADAALNEDQLIEVAREVGLSPEHLKQALAEERSRAQVPEESGMTARLFGPAHVHASRTIKGTTAATLERLDTWLQREESLQVKRRLFDRMFWEPRPGLFSEMRRLLNVSGRGYYLRPTREVGATVVPVDAERVLVRLEADLSNVRFERATSGAIVAGCGVLGTGALVVLGFFVPVAIIPAAATAVGGYFIARSHAPLVTRAQLALEQLLDRLERGDSPPPRPNVLSALDVWR